jgi:hypothetical protein
MKNNCNVTVVTEAVENISLLLVIPSGARDLQFASDPEIFGPSRKQQSSGRAPE